MRMFNPPHPGLSVKESLGVDNNGDVIYSEAIKL